MSEVFQSLPLWYLLLYTSKFMLGCEHYSIAMQRTFKLASYRPCKGSPPTCHYAFIAHWISCCSVVSLDCLKGCTVIWKKVKRSASLHEKSKYIRIALKSCHSPATATTFPQKALCLQFVNGSLSRGNSVNAGVGEKFLSEWHSTEQPLKLQRGIPRGSSAK